MFFLIPRPSHGFSLHMIMVYVEQPVPNFGVGNDKICTPNFPILYGSRIQKIPILDSQTNGNSLVSKSVFWSKTPSEIWFKTQNSHLTSDKKKLRYFIFSILKVEEKKVFIFFIRGHMRDLWPFCDLIKTPKEKMLGN